MLFLSYISLSMCIMTNALHITNIIIDWFHICKIQWKINKYEYEYEYEYNTWKATGTVCYMFYCKQCFVNLFCSLFYILSYHILKLLFVTSILSVLKIDIGRSSTPVMLDKRSLLYCYFFWAVLDKRNLSVACCELNELEKCIITASSVFHA